jgi:hypothetical protein
VRFFVTWCGVCAPLRDYDCFFFDDFSSSFRKRTRKSEKAALSRFLQQSAHKINKKMLGFITNRLLNALNCTYAPYASCKALMSVTPDDDVKWYNFLLSLFISIIVT